MSGYLSRPFWQFDRLVISGTVATFEITDLDFDTYDYRFLFYSAGVSLNGGNIYMQVGGGDPLSYQTSTTYRQGAVGEGPLSETNHINLWRGIRYNPAWAVMNVYTITDRFQWTINGALVDQSGSAFSEALATYGYMESLDNPVKAFYFYTNASDLSLRTVIYRSKNAI